ncbi:hypothetical protein [Nitrincola sp.]|uniref:hypothetical protein n=1 Tax=Nitrincola sp. TaxID=1926584 RepID=UPI003A8EA840
MIKERLISLFNNERTSTWFEKETGIDRYRWGNIRNGKARLSDAEIEAVVKIFPQYALWLVSGKVAPQAGQTSPELDEVRHSDSGKQSAG